MSSESQTDQSVEDAPITDETPIEDDAQPVVALPTPEDGAQPVATPSIAPENVSASVALQRWIEREFPAELRPPSTGRTSDTGYYARSDGRESAFLLHYSGHKPTTEAKLRIAAQRLEEQHIPYEWGENSYGYKYLRVVRYTWPEPGEYGPRVAHY